MRRSKSSDCCLSEPRAADAMVIDASATAAAMGTTRRFRGLGMRMVPLSDACRRRRVAASIVARERLGFKRPRTGALLRGQLASWAPRTRRRLPPALLRVQLAWKGGARRMRLGVVDQPGERREQVGTDDPLDARPLERV